MELSENPHWDILRFEKMARAKARYDRYVCAVASGEYSRHPDMVQGSEVIAMNALLLMLAADKRWEEYTKGGSDGE